MSEGGARCGFSLIPAATGLPLQQKAKGERSGTMDVEGNALAPNVLSIKQYLAEYSAERRRAGKSKLAYRFPVREGMGLPALGAPASAAAPALQLGFGFGPFLDEACRAALFEGEAESDSGSAAPQGVVSCAEPVRASRPSAAFEHAGLVGGYPLTIYSVSPFVLMANVERLDGIAAPRGWEDLLDPRFAGRVAVTAEPSEHNVAVLGTHALFGDDGVRALARNVMAGVSASVMALQVSDQPVLPGQDATPGAPATDPAPATPGAPTAPAPAPATLAPATLAPAVYVVPWFFARICEGRPNVQVIWPEEGALAFPLWMVLQKDATEAARDLAAHFAGEQFARESACLCLPTMNAASDEELPDEAKKLFWMGWDYFRTLDVPRFRRLIEREMPMIEGMHAR